MKLVFFDETADSANTNYLGVCGALIDSAKYGKIKRDFHSIMGKFGWDPSVEFKGSWIFSSSKGCQHVPVARRIELAKKIISMNVSGKNAAIKFCYAHTTEGSGKDEYLGVMGIVAKALLPCGNTTKQGKDIVAIFCDQRSDVTPKTLRYRLYPLIQRKHLTLLEDIQMVRSNTDTVGICYADIVGYLMSRIDSIEADSALFEGLNTEVVKKDWRLKKYLTSTSIIRSIKSMEFYKATREEK